MSMETPLHTYWRIRLHQVKEALENNHFGAYCVENKEEAHYVITNEILGKLKDIHRVARGDSLSFEATGLLDVIPDNPAYEWIDPFEEGLAEADMYERGRQALLSDLFFTGSNAVTESGLLVNLDGWGNRVGGLTFGPRHVVVVVGRNKIVPDLEAAMVRIKDYAAPVNAIRHQVKTPCVKTASCEDCNSPERICNAWTITEKSFPKGRIQVILINEDLGI